MNTDPHQELLAEKASPVRPLRPGVCNPNLQPRLPDAEIEALAAAGKALAHPVRIKILDLIAQGDGEVCSCDIERFFDLTQPTISHHLKILQESGLINSEPRGVWVYHKINPEALDLLRAHLADFNQKPTP